MLSNNNSFMSTYLYKLLNSPKVIESYGGVQTNELLFNNISNFINPCTILDTFYLKSIDFFSIPTIQYVLDSGTTDYFLSLWKYVESFDFIVRLNADNALLNIQFNADISTSSEFFKLNSRLISELLFLTQPKTEVFNMTEVVPEHQDTIELFEVISVNVDNSLYAHLHMPEFKLYYPEPYIASPSFVHEEVWFIHILHYQHWLWFFFISLIMFFFITFINVVRWCNPRNKPKRETRGVSRSKCADLITACVPVTWALSIIISESVDAADYYDGFGTGEIVVGVRSYQWGWEYFFPKNIDLNYNVNPTYSSLTGNSLKYTKTQGSNSASNQFWKSMRSKTQTEMSSVPAHMLLSPSDNNNILNFTNFNNLGSSTLTNSSAFKKVQFSTKTTPQNLFNSSSDFSLKYNKIFDLYISDMSTQDNLSYGNTRQHNYSSKLSTTNGFSTQLDNKTVSELIDYNYNTSLQNGNTETVSSQLPTHNLNLSSNVITSSTTTTDNNSVVSDLGKEFGTSKSAQQNLITDNVEVSHSLSNIQVTNQKLNSSPNMFDYSLFYKTFQPKSSNQQVLSGDRNIRNFDVANPSKVNVSLDTNQPSTNLLSNSYSNSVNSTDNSNLQKSLLSSNTVFPHAHLPSASLGTKFVNINYDRFTSNGMNPSIMSAKEELAPNFVFTPFWSSLWSTTNVSNRLASINNYFNTQSNLALPAIVEYSEYDFKNWTALESLEDLFWESSFSSYTQDEYINILQDVNTFTSTQKQELLFNELNRSMKTKQNTLVKPLLRDLVFATNLNTLPLFSEEVYVNTQLAPQNSFGIYDSESEFDTFDGSYNNIKFLNYIHHLNYVNTLNTYNLGMQPLSYSQVLNSFRANYDEQVLSSEPYLNISEEVSDNVNVSSSLDIRSSNPIKLRSTAKNSVVTFNALQKVFRPRFDEGRSNIRFQDLSNSYVKYPYLSESRVGYESLLGKNKESFYGVNAYKTMLSSKYNSLSPVFNSLNIYFSNLPFLMSMQSDAVRHLWFDWQSRWSSIEVQPSSVARYSLLGIPYSNKYFEYNTQAGDEVNDSETYLIRLTKARKNYMSNWALTPYFYSRVSNWYASNGYVNQTFNNPTVENLRLTLALSSKFWTDNNITNLSNISTPSVTDINTPGRSSWKPLAGVQAYNYNLGTLSDLLTKREYLYREYFLNQGYTVNLPKYLLASPTNTLYQEVKKSYPLMDPSTFTTEVSRDFFYENTNLFKFNILKNLYSLTSSKLIQDTLSASNLINYTFFYLFNTDSFDKLSNNNDLYKNQFRPLRKGVSNMIRLHATGAIAMPIEIRLHILASSRDIIHSWAIPSAGIKIDCVPGYSSHRVAIFLVSGIFWGQCMEICGRFHHWMPIIVYFMKRDLFFLWCTHFIHFSPSDLSFSTNDLEYRNKVSNVSYDASSWASNSTINL